MSDNFNFLDFGEYEDAFDLGSKAFLDGNKANKNPFKFSEQINQHIAWLDGFNYMMIKGENL